VLEVWTRIGGRIAKALLPTRQYTRGRAQRWPPKDKRMKEQHAATMTGVESRKRRMRLGIVAVVLALVVALLAFGSAWFFRVSSYADLQFYWEMHRKRFDSVWWDVAMRRVHKGDDWTGFVTAYPTRDHMDWPPYMVAYYTNYPYTLSVTAKDGKLVLGQVYTSDPWTGITWLRKFFEVPGGTDGMGSIQDYNKYVRERNAKANKTGGAEGAESLFPDYSLGEYSEDGGTWLYPVTRKVAQAQPVWDGVTGEPPLTVSAAVKVAATWLAKNHPDRTRFVPSRISLELMPMTHYENRYRWYYLIWFSAHATDPFGAAKTGPTKGLPQNLYVHVLLDGTVVEPVLKKDQRR